MDRDTLKERLNSINWKSFRASVAGILESDANSSSVLAGLYTHIRLGKIFPSKGEDFFYGLIWLVTPFWLVLQKIFWAPRGYPKKARAKRLSSSQDFDGAARTADILVVLSAGFPSLFESLHRVLSELDKRESKVAALLFPAVVKGKTADIAKIQRCDLVSLGDELWRLNIGDIFGAAWRAKRQTREGLGRVKDETVGEFLRINRSLMRLLFMFDDLYEAAYRRLFARMKPKVVVDNWFNGAMRKVTKELGIYTVMLQHGTQWGDDKPGVTPDEDELIIWGEFWRENFQRSVLPTTKLIPLGCPRFDGLKGQREKARDARFYEGMKLSAQKLTVTFLSQSHGFQFPEKTRQTYLAVVASLGELLAARADKINFIVKLHPHDDPAYYKALWKEDRLKDVRFLKHEVPLYDLFRHSDIAISVTSTALLEAIGMDLAAIQFQCEELPDWIDFCSPGGGFLVRNGEELIRVIDAIGGAEAEREMIREARAKFIEECLVNLGGATKAVADHLEERVSREL